VQNNSLRMLLASSSATPEHEWMIFVSTTAFSYFSFRRITNLGIDPATFVCSRKGLVALRARVAGECGVAQMARVRDPAKPSVRSGAGYPRVPRRSCQPFFPPIAPQS
jgi:hypothetical protein